jgi:HEPN domain-containing protein
MANERARAQDTKDWIAKAKEDLAAARRLLTPPRQLSNSAVFHCQQAVEKALKGFLAWHDVPLRKTHNLLEVGGACAEIDATLSELVERAAPLTEYAWKFRYPGEVSGVSAKEAQQALALASEILKAVVARVPTTAKRKS